MLRTPIWHALPSPCGRFWRTRLRLADSSLRLPIRLVRSLATTCPRWSDSPEDHDNSQNSKEVRQRIAELEHARPGVTSYPRWLQSDTLTEHGLIDREGASDIATENSSLLSIRQTVTTDQSSPNATSDGPDAKIYQVAGRIAAIRSAGKSLAFIDVQADAKIFQIKLNQGKIPAVTHQSFQDLTRLLRRGDHISVRGFATTTKLGLPALEAVELPVLRAPCLQRMPLPRSLSERDPDRESTAGRHVEMLTYPSLVETLKVRSYLIGAMRSKLDGDGFLEVQTPILGAEAGGASARPFITTATEFTDRKLALRIAPELWLKRLMVGGLNQVFEIGPSFRNEGLDKVHNPEFTTCEFYAAYLDIERLTHYTERILASVATRIEALATVGSYDQSVISGWKIDASQSFPKLDFIPAINAALSVDLPNLASPSARDDVLKIFEDKNIHVPPTPTLPRLLDTLSSRLLEPQCHEPTWIINTPECLSPLSKSFTHPTTPNSQSVAARAELFIRGKEVVNCYEEENSPGEQRRKFMDQQRYARLDGSDGGVGGGGVDEEAMSVDEDYIRALEWGLPPTGGWGCGIDRLVMLATGMERIGDVLSFGNLRAVTRGAVKVGG